jgi:hypothetical protein
LACPRSSEDSLAVGNDADPYNSNMKFSEATIRKLTDVISGTSGSTGYRSGPKLVAVFNELGFNDVYGQGFPSRDTYVAERIRAVDRAGEHSALLEFVFDPLQFLPGGSILSAAVEQMRPYLQRDGAKLEWDGERYRVTDLRGLSVSTPAVSASNPVTNVFIKQQLQKCDAKLARGDSDGAITNARSLVEAVLKDAEERLGGACEPYGGDLVKLFRRVQRLLNLDPSSASVGDSERQVLSGLTSIVNGLAGMRNEKSDAHAAGAVASEGDARLAVNAAKTLCGFVHDRR